MLIEKLQVLIQRNGVYQVYLKHLAKTQENDKNQIYLGSGNDGVANILPPRERDSTSQLDAYEYPKGNRGRSRFLL